jgi:steroid 5-alpha reductase family enzyme
MDVAKELIANLFTFTDAALAPYPGILQTSIANPLTATTTLLLVGILFCWVNNITTGYWSWVDRCWSTFPAFYAIIYVFFNYTSTAADNRIYLMGILVIL